MGLKMKMFFLWLKLASLAWWAYAHKSQIVVGLTLLGSGIVMKLAPAFNLLSRVEAQLPQLPIDMGLKALNKEITSSYGKFVKVPYLDQALSFTGLNAHSFMVTLSVIDLIFAMLILVPKGRRPAQIAGLWMFVEMCGAEYCVRQSGAYMSNVTKLPQYKIVMSVVHICIAGAGLTCLKGKEALNLSGWFLSFLPSFVQKRITGLIAKVSTSSKKISDTAKKVESKVEARGRGALPSGSSQKRTSTPGAKSTAKKTK